MRNMKKRMAIALCALLMLMPIAHAEEGFHKEYGASLKVDIAEPLPEIPKIERRYIAGTPIASDEFIASRYGVKKVEDYDDEGETVRVYEDDNTRILTRGKGTYYYEDKHLNPAVESLLYYCVDARDYFVPDGGWLVNDDELDFMSAEEACALVENDFKGLFPETFDSFEIKLTAHPVHPEDMKSKVTDMLKSECKTQEDLDFQKRKYGLYEGCIAEDESYYFVEGMWYFDGIPMFKGTEDVRNNYPVDGPRLWAIVSKDGLAYMDANSLLYTVEDEAREQPIVCDSEDVLTRIGRFFDRIPGDMPLYEIAKVELVYMQFPLEDGRYEMTPILMLSEYDEMDNGYEPIMKVNITEYVYEIIF